MASREHTKRNGPGRRDYDGRECPFHEAHERQLTGLTNDMKTKVGLKAAAILISAFLGGGSLFYMAINKYVESATESAVALLRVHIVKSEEHMIDIHSQLDQIKSTQRITNYRLNKLDKTPEYPRPGPGNWPDPKL